jgi:hypothetical protein
MKQMVLLAAAFVVAVFVFIAPAYAEETAPPPQESGQQQAAGLNNQAVQFYKDGKYAEAAAAAEKALELANAGQAPGALNPVAMVSMNHLANIYLAMGRYGESTSPWAATAKPRPTSSA